MVKILHAFCIRLQRKRCFFFFSLSSRRRKKKLRAAICRPWDVFLLDSPGPRLAGPSSGQSGHSLVCCDCLAPVHARPPRGAGPGREGGRPAGWAAATPGTAQLCGHVLCLPSLCPPRACSGPAVPPAARRAPTPCPPRVPSPSGPGLPASGPARARGARPRPRHCRRSPHPAARARRRAWHGAKLPGSPARAGELSGKGVCGEGRGVQWCQGRERPRCPAAAPTPARAGRGGLPLPPVS